MSHYGNSGLGGTSLQLTILSALLPRQNPSYTILILRSPFPTSSIPFTEMVEVAIQGKIQATASLCRASLCILNANFLKNPRARRCKESYLRFSGESRGCWCGSACQLGKLKQNAAQDSPKKGAEQSPPLKLCQAMKPRVN